MEPVGGAQAYLDAFVTTGVNVISCQLHAPAALHPEKRDLGGLLGSRAVLVALEKAQMSCCCRESSQRFLVCPAPRFFATPTDCHRFHDGMMIIILIIIRN